MRRLVSLAVLASACAFCAPVPTAAPHLPTGLLNAREAFGVVGDGVADDTEGIHRIFRAKRPVLLPNGTYRIAKTVHALSTTQTHGGGGGWNPKGQSTILYDGPEGGTALKIANSSSFSMRHATVNGDGRPPPNGSRRTPRRRRTVAFRRRAKALFHPGRMGPARRRWRSCPED